MVVIRSPVTVLDRWAALGVPDQTLAAALAVDLGTLERWRSGAHPERSARERLAALARLHARLTESFDDRDDLRAWLYTENHYLGGVRPLDTLGAGRLERVEAALEALDSGFFV